MVDPAAHVNCYSCASSYHYLGRQPRPAVCPNCGSRVVDPVGELSYERADAMEITTRSRSEHASLQLVTSDALGREVTFWFIRGEADVDGGPDAPDSVRTASLWRIVVDDTLLDPVRVAGEPICPVDTLQEFLSTTVPEQFRADVVVPVSPDHGDDASRDSGSTGSVDGSGDADDDFGW